VRENNGIWKRIAGNEIMEATQKKNKYEIDMCNGTIMDKLISFALPLMVSSILQLLFNAVDIIVVGRFTGSQALAAERCCSGEFPFRKAGGDAVSVRG
jgi:hypothetical protein